MQDTPADLNPETHHQVAKLLGAARAAEMLGLLRDSLVRLGDMPVQELSSPSSLALVHRLKSESGLMGFDRLSRACEAVDTAGARGGVPPDDLQNLREAVVSALAMADTLGKPGP
ncbi:Hpt domain-containing protein [Methylobacterium oryzisoli]|uniref:Hpt domain-containing protein n=1 Tax=Methylobacterium oryzisoli TaxID=3385502 RepID=UPI00389236FF